MVINELRIRVLAGDFDNHEKQNYNAIKDRRHLNSHEHRYECVRA